MLRRLLSAAAACSLLLGLAACGEGDDGPVTTPPPEIDIGDPSDGGGGSDASDGGGGQGDPSAASKLPAPDPADYPGMDENTEAGAQQFTKYFFALLMWGYQTGESSAIEDLYLDSCGICETNVEPIRQYREKGVAWSRVDLRDVKLSTMDAEGTSYDRMVNYEVIVSEHTEPALDGGEDATFNDTHFTFQSGLTWNGSGWMVAGAALDVKQAE